MANRNERYNEILDMLKVTTYATVESLAQQLHISSSSIRRDLATLEARGKVVRSHGGVELLETGRASVSFSLRFRENAGAKRRIAEKAAELVNDGDVVFLDGSTSAMYLAHKLAQKNGITIITNGVNAAQYLSDYKIKVICTGGTLDTDDRSMLVGSDALRMVREMRADWMFFSVSALDDDGKMYDFTREGVAVARQMMECARQKVCLCDSSKLGKTSTYWECDLGELDYLICDVPLTPIYGEAFPNTRFL